MFAESTEKRDVVAKHGVIRAGMLNGSVELTFYAGDGLEQQLAQIAEGIGGLMRDAFFGEGGEDFAEDVVYVGDGVELAGKGGKLSSKLFGFEALLLFACVVDAERIMALFAKHAAGTAVGELAETLAAVWIDWI